MSWDAPHTQDEPACSYGLQLFLWVPWGGPDQLNFAWWLQLAAGWHDGTLAATFPGTIQWGFYHHVAALESRSGKIATDMTHWMCIHQSYISHALHMNESCHTYKWVISLCEWVLSHVWMCHVTHMNESCYTYECVMSHMWVSHITVWMSFVTHMNVSRHTYEWVMSHIRMRHVTHMSESYHRVNESCHTYEWVTSHIWMSHVTHMNIWIRHVKHMNESCHT